MLQDEFSDSSLTQGAGSSHGSDTAFLLHQLAVDQSYQFPLHGSTQQALGSAAQTHTWWEFRQHKWEIKEKDTCQILHVPSLVKCSLSINQFSV